MQLALVIEVLEGDQMGRKHLFLVLVTINIYWAEGTEGFGPRAGHTAPL